VLTLDADDELNGRNTFKLYNWGFQTLKSGVLYTNYYRLTSPNQGIKMGLTSIYTDEEKSQNLYRKTNWKTSHLKSFRSELLHKIKPKDLQYDDGRFFTVTSDMAIFFPLMDQSCGRVDKIEG